MDSGFGATLVGTGHNSNENKQVFLGTGHLKMVTSWFPYHRIVILEAIQAVFFLTNRPKNQNQIRTT
jgi:hypothetical protein